MLCDKCDDFANCENANLLSYDICDMFIPIVRVYNGTAHDIHIVSGAELDSTDRKWKGGKVFKTIPKSEQMLNVIFAGATPVPTHIIGVMPIFETKIKAIDPLPEGYDVYIVSAMYGTAYREKYPEEKRLYGAYAPVMSSDGKTFVGCLGLQRF